MLTPSTLLVTGLSDSPPPLVPATRRPAAAPEPVPGPAAGLSLSWRAQGGHTIAALTGELDIASAAALREQLLGLLRPNAARLVIDLSGVSYCDASGLAVLVGTGRRAELLGGVLRLAAPGPLVGSALRVMGLHRRFDVFPSVSAAVASRAAASPRTASPRTASPRTAAAAMVAAAPVTPPASVKMAATVAAGAARVRRAAGAGDLRAAVAALLSYSDAWRDADPDRRFAPALQVLARAYTRTGDAGTDHARLAEAARSLLSVLTEHALTYSAPVADTASRLRRLLDTG
jgi:anti-anti-sigma factor